MLRTRRYGILLEVIARSYQKEWEMSLHQLQHCQGHKFLVPNPEFIYLGIIEFCLKLIFMND
jgi:hypothetical protein